MKAYVAVTGILFVAIVAAHVLRAFAEQGIVRDPWFIATTILSLGLSAWALVVLRR